MLCVLLLHSINLRSSLYFHYAAGLLYRHVEVGGPRLGMSELVVRQLNLSMS